MKTRYNVRRLLRLYSHTNRYTRALDAAKPRRVFRPGMFSSFQQERRRRDEEEKEEEEKEAKEEEQEEEDEKEAEETCEV